METKEILESRRCDMTTETSPVAVDAEEESLDKKEDTNDPKHEEDDKKPTAATTETLDRIRPKTSVRSPRAQNSARSSILSPMRNSTTRISAKISPMAASLIRHKTGRDIIHVHTVPVRKSTRTVLSPADSRAIAGDVVPVRVPNLRAAYRHPRDEEGKIIEMDSVKGLKFKPFDVTQLEGTSKSVVHVLGKPVQDINDTSTLASSPLSTQTGEEDSLSGEQDGEADGEKQQGQQRNETTKEEENALMTTMSTPLGDIAIVLESPDACTPCISPQPPIPTKRRRAVIIGISYRLNANQRTYFMHSQSVQKWFDILIRRLGFISEEIRILTDTPKTSRNGNAVTERATPENIRKSLDWLVQDARHDDDLLFMYSGDTAYELGTDRGDVSQPGRHGIVPSNYPEGDVIWDSELHHMVKALPQGSKLTMFLDCKLSWNLVRLPSIYLPYRTKRFKPYEVLRGYAPESWAGSNLMSLVETATKSGLRWERRRAGEQLQKQKDYYEGRLTEFEGCGQTVCFAATPTKYDMMHRARALVSTRNTKKVPQGTFVRAAEEAIELILREGMPFTYGTLMMSMARIMSPSGCWNQVPQVCASREIDMNEEFPIKL